FGPAGASVVTERLRALPLGRDDPGAAHAGREHGLVAVGPPDPVHRAGRAIQDLDDLALPGRCPDPLRLDDDPVSHLAGHVASRQASMDLYRGPPRGRSSTRRHPKEAWMEIWLARHGETEWSKSGQHTGSTDIPLTPEGAEQARRLGALLEGHRFEQVLTSPLTRARETARGAGFGDRAQVSDLLREFDYGGYEGRTTGGIQQARPRWE